MAKYVFGIDLGTTYSCISYVDETGRPVVIKNMEGDSTTPSVVNFADPSSVSVGQVAKENAVIDPKNTISLVKTLIGKSDFAINYNGEDKSPEEVSSYILRKLTSDAAKMIDAEVKDVVITVPAYFGTKERVATENAGIIAGLNVLDIISEPTAAALYYGCTKGQDEKTVLVYDLGGGTFDVTIMHISDNKIEVICSDGNHSLGGKHWDEAIMRYLANAFISETGFGGDFDEYAQQDLRLKAEGAKKQLTSRNEVPVMLDAAGLRARISLSKEVFNEITAGLLNDTIEKTDAALAVAKGKEYTVSEILLVGGSTKMPQVAEALMAKYGMEPKVLDPDEAVAKGAAIHAVDVYNGIKTAGGEDVPNVTIGGRDNQPVEVVHATTKSYALKILHKGAPKCINMIIKNQSMPDGAVSVSKQFGTFAANQTSVEIVVFENDFMDEYFEVDEDYILGTALLEDLPDNLPANSPIEVTFALGINGILDVTGRDVTSGKTIHTTMQATGIMAADMVEELKLKSKDIVVM